MPFSSNHNSYGGLALPNAGAAHFQQNSTKDALTLEHSSDNAGRFVTFRDYQAPSQGKPSTITSNDLSYIDAQGRFAGPRDYVGNVLAVDGASTLIEIASSNSGKLHVISTQAASSVFIHLPSSGTLAVGMKFEFLHNSTAAGILHFMTTGANAGGVIYHHVDSTNLIATTGALSNVSTGAMWLEFVCLSTAGPLWALQNKMASPNNSTAQLETLAVATTA